MKIFVYILMALAFALAVFNITQLDFEHLTEGDSMPALIGAITSLCAVLILAIFRTAKIIDEKTKR